MVCCCFYHKIIKINFVLSFSFDKKIKRILMSVTEALKNRLRVGDSNLPILYKGEEQSLTVIKEKLKQFEGGSIDLTIRNDNIGIVTLNQPLKRNAISGKMMGDLSDVVNELENWKEGKGIILQGKNGNFCSGGDLDLARGTNNPDGGFLMATFMGVVLNRFRALPLITVAVIEGCGALGGGAEISTACDYRFISESSRGIGFVHGRMGIIPAWGGTGRLVQMIGYRKAVQVLSSTKIYSPDDAFKIGLVDEIIPSNVDPQAFALDWLQKQTRVSSNVIRGIKTTALLVQGDPDNGDLEKRIFAPYWGCVENKTALNANIKHK